MGNAQHPPTAEYSSRVEDGFFWVQFQSRLDLVDRAVVEILAFLRACALPGYDDFEIEVVIREGLTNSVVHGNQEDLGKKVVFEARVRDNQLTLVFEDQGAGFDWRKKRAVDSVDAELDCGRGILLMRSYGYDLRGNARGNRIELVRVFSVE
ncbi:ATP-binding protein [Acanthopleuribacter pedis]|uniref:ATP-binding protein n=1 Tax=Acanthopleuribacter pedis TaxID=442870 RepID=A0A8J7Q444_9BACT|nr:ATP-binding protein [Acanthopleuribacter pedis]MBO1317697.1 ATP-binding protein [Acanthopleuribacter pedis]